MRSLHKRLKRLEEASGFDQSGLAAHSPQWLAYWNHQLELNAAGEPFIRLPLEAMRAVLQAMPDDDE